MRRLVQLHDVLLFVENTVMFLQCYIGSLVHIIHVLNIHTQIKWVSLKLSSN